ncbi:hypothetical protein BBO99_00006449 [Phytophthora kernoviae]|uniref:Pseudouridine synthase RsuA/RluA-like domain-containing protein n=2 Tax=Phytophthora kernoviae TaxID=325452 RepID=A0A3R7GWZ4_9STRA|nr:hypothetical protein G195_003573 [Phytophthora kernoviae 00238/432]KAG2522258.1 hypothetical protein JM16_002231 [Phytophthora kernoviae]KAG2522870.1 hypothetical protein JM18_003951 [Phytophthora kernoviae]RLN44161.1 hypothetical protein BBI17_002626 [Phytophthora kernoviae]RLN77813.1 hypothetical protein BBO99_00006449 [Phytophthora kernoviae]
MWRQELRWMRHIVRAQDQELRLDRWLRLQFPSLPQSFLQTQLRKRKIRLQPPLSTISDIPLKPQATQAKSLLFQGSVIAIDAHLFHSKLQPNTPLIRQETKILPPHGLAVQEGSALTDSLARYLPSIAGELGKQQEQEPMKLVHRLDKETSGLLVLARSRLAAAKFSELLRCGAVLKTYEALVSPTPSTQASYATLKRFEGKEITLPIDSKPACTLVERVLKQNERSDPAGIWLQLKPCTGRKHQIRVHCAEELRSPIVGDTKYGGSAADRLYLHAKRIQFPDPFKTGQMINVSCSRQAHKW